MSAAGSTVHGHRPILVTDVGMTRQQEFALRRRRYDTLMFGRVLCVIAAFVVGSVWSNVWLAGVFIAFAAVLPWAAVLIANDRLPIAAQRRRAADHVASPSVPQLAAPVPSSGPSPAPTSEHLVVEG